MKHTPLAAGLSRALFCAALLPACLPAFAQDMPGDANGAASAATAGAGAMAAKDLDAIVVQADIAYRNRSDVTPPTLVYDLEYFQRFEPLTVGDMLKRVPSVAFVSDVLEYDGAQLRGLDPGYTQILINGKKVPGAGADRSFFVDRIPAELVERIEIIRSPSANRSADAVAGSLNIVLRDAYEFDGAYVRAGAMHFDDGKTKGTFGAVGSGEVGNGRLLGGINIQGRHNPKFKRSDRYEEPDGDFVDAEDQDDIRDGYDYSANASYVLDVGDTGRLTVDAFYVMTDRDEREHSLEYNDQDAGDRDHLLSENHQLEDIDQDNWSLGAGYAFEMAGGRTAIDFEYARFDEHSVSTEEEVGYDDDDAPPSFDEFEGEREISDIEDTELGVTLSHKRDVGRARMEFGLDTQDKRRDTGLRLSEVDTDVEGAPLPPYDSFEAVSARIDERRIDPYLMFSGTGGMLAWEAGLRYETTDADIEAEGMSTSNDYNFLLPSLHLKWDLTDNDRVSFSLARTVRRPNFDYILPLFLEGEYGDNDFIGNPALDPELANGVDLGYERRLGRRGVVGINAFYRDVSDLIEVVNTGVPSVDAEESYEEDVEDFLADNPGADPSTPGYPEFDPDSFVYTTANVGDGYVWGVELDMSTPLGTLGMPNTGVFVNYSWLDSEVEDDFGKRRFNNQPKYVYNVGFIQDIPSWGASFGASYRRQGDAYMRILAEEVRTSYGADLELFVEKRFGDNFAVRLTGSNLLDASKDEYFHKFDNAADQFDRDYDEYETETEAAGPVYQLIARYAF